MLGLGPIPYYTVGPWSIGSLTIHSFGLMVAIGVLVAHAVGVRRSDKLGHDGDAFRALALYMLIFGFVMAHVLNVILYEPAQVLKNPGELLNITGSLSSYGGVVGAILGWVVWCWRNPLKNHSDYADIAFFALPVGWLFGRIGCALVHDHPGALTDFAFAIDFGAHPPGGVRHDLGLYEACWWLVIVAVFFALDRFKPDLTRAPMGLITALLPLMYAPVRFALDFLRVPPHLGGDVRYAGLTPGQYISIGAFLVGLALLRRWFGMRARAKAAPEPAAKATAKLD